MRNRKKLFLIAPFAIVGLALFIALGGWIVMSLWNWLLPSLFGWKLITFWQALAMLVLCRILFGGFGGHRSMRPHRRWRMRAGMAEHWERMSPEERERFRAGMHGRCGIDPEPPTAGQ
jgi:hypothetical protein